MGSRDPPQPVNEPADHLRRRRRTPPPWPPPCPEPPPRHPHAAGIHTRRRATAGANHVAAKPAAARAGLPPTRSITARSSGGDAALAPENGNRGVPPPPRRPGFARRRLRRRREEEDARVALLQPGGAPRCGPARPHGSGRGGWPARMAGLELVREKGGGDDGATLRGGRREDVEVVPDLPPHRMGQILFAFSLPFTLSCNR